VRLGILGPLLVADDDGREIWVAAARQRTLLAALLVRANRMASVDELAELVWDGVPPAGAARTVRSYMARLRQAVGPSVADRIVTRDPGYCCRVAEDELDALEFATLCQAADTALRAADWDQAAAATTRALRLWRGPLLTDVTSQTLREQVVRRFDQLRLQALENRAEARLRLHQHELLIPELRDLTTQYPLRERFHAQLMRALVRSGCRADALAVYRSARTTLVGELGVEPGSELRELHQAILADDPVLVPAQNTGPARSYAVPRQLPAEAAHFIGRARELRTLSELLDQAQPSGGAVVISAIGGTAGVGKTALAVHWAHHIADRFPDGHLYVNLRGYDEHEPLPSTDALAGFLRALGVDGRDVPPDEAERSALYRSLLSDRRMLIVLDNARGAHQVRPLLPGTVGCVTLVTSRGSLTGLVARDGAVRMELAALALDEATTLLERLLGPRAAVEQGVDALAERCCRLPLALRLAAELAAARPATPLPVLVDELADLQHRLDALDADGDDGAAIRGVLSWSYRGLDAGTARAFRLIGLHPGADFDVPAAAGLIGTTREDAERLVDRLTRAHLLQPAGPDATRHGMHDLLRAYARERAAAEDTEHERQAALTGLLDHYLHTAAAAMNVLYPTESSRRPTLAAPAGTLVLAPVAELSTARAWLDAERANLIAVAAFAADHGRPGHTTALASTVDRYLSFGHHLAEASAIHGHALRAARLGGGPSAEATALSHLGFVAWMRNRYQQAADLQRQALALFEAAGDRAGQARVLHRLALAERALGNLCPAEVHSVRVLRISREDGDRLGQARALQSLGITALDAGRTAAAAHYLSRSMIFFDELGDRLGQSVTARELGVVELSAGRLEPAVALFHRSLALCQETNNPAGQAGTLSRLGEAFLRRGRHAEAVEHQQRALALYRKVKDHYGEAETLIRLAAAQLDAGHAQDAMANLNLALRLARELATPRLEAAARNGIGDTLRAASHPDQAPAH